MKKKNLLWTLAAAFALASCSDTELMEMPPQVQEQNAIAFDTYVGDNAQSRAVVVNDSCIKLKGFGVNAYYTGQTPFNADGTYSNNEIFMDNTKVTYNEEKKAWTYSPLKYWPNNTGDKVSFFAYAPYKSNFVEVDGKNRSVLGFTVAPEALEQVDLIYHKADGDVNLGYEKTVDQTKPDVTKKIKFNFQHALSRIAFDVKAVVDETNANGDNLLDGNTRINIKEVALVKADEGATAAEGPFYGSAALNLQTGTWSDKTGAQPFVLDGDNFYRSVVENNDTVVQLTKFNPEQRLLNDESYLMIIPQDFNKENGETKEGFRIYIEYDVISEEVDNNGDAGNTTNDHNTITNKIYSESIHTTFEQGKAYKFRILLGMTSVKFEATVTDWGNEINGGDYWLPENMAKEIQGLGTDENPYEIWTLANLNEMRDNINGNDAREVPEGGQPWASAVYKQMADVTVTASRAEGSWEPVSSFSGKYLGNEKKIIGLTISNEDTEFSNYYAWIASNTGTIQDLTVEAYITTSANAAAIAGSNNGTITNCSAEGTLTGANIGGLVTENGGTISGCTNFAELKSSADLGGIASDNTYGSQIINCQNRGIGICTHVSATEYDSSSQGGIVARNNGNVENCQNYVNVTGIRVGGIAGTNDPNGTTTACYNEGTITGLDNSDAHTGGIVGFTDNATIVACYNRGAVKAADGVTFTYGAGGIAGYNTGTITIKGCYHNNDQSDGNCGGLLGFIDGTCEIVSEGNYYAGVNTAYGSNPSENADIATEVDGSNVTWETAKTAMNNVLNELYNDGENPQYDWKYVESTTTEPLTLETGVAEYVAIPYTSFEKATEASENGIPTLYIKSAADLAGLANNVANKFKYDNKYSYAKLNYIQVADIDLSTECSETLGSWLPIGAWGSGNNFEGTYSVKERDDNEDSEYEHYVIKNLYIKGQEEEYLGLFGWCYNASLQNIHLVNASIEINKGYSGGITGVSNSGLIQGCSFAGTFQLNGRVQDCGAIVGLIYDGDKVSECSFVEGTVIVNGDATYCGGIVGSASGSVENCSISNSVTMQINDSKSEFGGVIGNLQDGYATGCFNEANITAENTSCEIGGVIGWMRGGKVKGCWNTGTIKGKKVGGVIGEADNYCAEASYIYGCYNTGTLNGETNSAGIVCSIELTFQENDELIIAGCYDTQVAESGIVSSIKIDNDEYNNNLTLTDCFYASTKAYSTLSGILLEESNNHQVDETACKWIKGDEDGDEVICAKTEMNTALTNASVGWFYSANTGDDASTRPLVINKN